MIYFLLTTTAQASLYFLDSSVRGHVMRRAYVAGANTISAQWYNPAALTRTRWHVWSGYCCCSSIYRFRQNRLPDEGPLDENDDQRILSMIQ